MPYFKVYLIMIPTAAHLVLLNGPGAVFRLRSGRPVEVCHVRVGEVVGPRRRAARRVAHDGRVSVFTGQHVGLGNTVCLGRFDGLICTTNSGVAHEVDFADRQLAHLREPYTCSFGLPVPPPGRIYVEWIREGTNLTVSTLHGSWTPKTTNFIHHH